MEDLLNRYTLELKNKISLKGISNKTEKQILFQTFKYFDTNTNGYSNFDTFIKVNQKIGVIMSNPQDFQNIFSFFDKNNEGIINYEDFINKIFTSSDTKNNQNKKNINYSNTNFFSSYNNKKENMIFKNTLNNRKNDPPYKKPFFDKILNTILNNEIGPSLSLLILHQGFIIGDNNFMNQITIEEFIKIIKNNNIDLSISDIQMLFHSYELNNDGFFYYEEMFNDLLNIYWNNQRQRIAQRKSEEIINSLNKEGGLQLNLLENLIYVRKNYENFFWDRLKIYDANEYYKELMKKYIGLKRVLNCSTRDTFLTFDDLEEIMKYISFGIKNNVDFNKTINYIFNLNQINQSNQNNQNNQNAQINKNKNNIKSLTPSKKNNKNKNFNNKNYDNNNNNCNISVDYFTLFRNYFIENGIITCLNLLKTFQYYDNGEKQIKINDFIKIMKDYKIKISSNIIEQIFSISNSNNINMFLNYISFISEIIDKFVNKNIINLINSIYDTINNYCLKLYGNSMHLDFFKKFFNINNNYFFNNPTEALSNILIVFERFHYDFYIKYKIEENNEKNDLNFVKVEKNEFLWFYKFLNLFINDEIIFQNVILNDWKKILNLNINSITMKKDIMHEEKSDDRVYKNDSDKEIINNNININKKKKNNNANNNLIKQTPILMNKNINVIKNNNNKEEINEIISNNNINDKNKNNNEKEENKKNNNELYENEDALKKMEIKLKMRGIRGVMNLHKQFIISCKDLSNITFEEFIKVMNYQRLSLTNDEYHNLFLLFVDEDNTNNLNFPKFIRAFKKVLNEKRLSAIEKIFTKLDINGNDKVLIDDIKMKFNAKKHISVLNGEKNEEEILCEFLDCFDLNNNLLITKDNQDENNMINFEEFANFYEYVSFLYDNDDEFIKLIENCW